MKAISPERLTSEEVNDNENEEEQKVGTADDVVKDILFYLNMKYIREMGG